jgi:hypothetical protein
VYVSWISTSISAADTPFVRKSKVKMHTVVNVNKNLFIVKLTGNHR